MVSTDDPKIAKVARESGATVPFMRSAANSDDFATLADVIEEIKDTYSNREKYFKYVCCILPTAPLITIKNLRKGFDILNDSNADSVKPVVKYSYPIQRALKLKNKKVEMINPENLRARSQDLEPAYYDAGQFYWMRFDSGLVGPKKFGFIISEMESQDIDSHEDWNLAELKYKLNRKSDES